ncbi:MAG: FAD-dependent monooxygenase [Phycisphaerae bacterium]|nr:FAD-dependent monooxygenase [Phycisphaerae bacterium]
MTRTHQPRFTIVGGGLAGGVLANYLGAAGFEVHVYEKRPDQRKAGVIGGRSINLALSVRGMHALGEIGVLDSVMKQAVPMPGRMIHAIDGSTVFQPYGTRGEAINSVSRGGLNCILLDAAERYAGVKLHFDHKCLDVDIDTGETTYERSGGQIVKASGDIVIGADGAFSPVRARMQRLDRFDYSQNYLEHGYKELHIPPADGGGWRIEKNALHIWPRRSYMMIALPNADGSFTVTCFWPFDGANGFNNLRNGTDVVAYFNEHFRDAVPLMPTLATDFFENPTSTLVTVRCAPWYYKDRVVMLGDAAHAIVPFFGQGMNCAFEDCTALIERIRSADGDYESAFRAFNHDRKRHADAIADLALQNFIEMRDKVGDPAFLRKKQWEKRLHRWFPKSYTPLYELVSFTRVGYADAVDQARRQELAIALIMQLLIVGVSIVILLILALSYFVR